LNEKGYANKDVRTLRSIVIFARLVSTREGRNISNIENEFCVCVCVCVWVSPPRLGALLRSSTRALSCQEMEERSFKLPCKIEKIVQHFLARD